MGCRYFGKCGGCSYIDTDYAAQLEIKQRLAGQELGKLASSCGCVIEPVIGADDPLYYRNKVHSVLSFTKKGQVIRGMYMEDSHKVVDVRGCRLEDRTADEIIEEIRRLIPSFKLKIFDEDTGYGFLRHILVRVAQNSAREYMVVLVTAQVQFPGKNNFIRALRSKFPQISTVIQNINDKKTSMVLGKRNITLYGKGFIVDGSLGLDFRISPSSFFQINPSQTVKLYGLAMEMAGLDGSQNVLDSYCGTGTIGMFMSRNAKHVTGVELNEASVADARFNAKQNKIGNIDFVCGDSTRFMQGLAEEGRNDYDVLCLDPPRSGTTKEFIDAAADLKIKRVVYVSCEPHTMARDLDYFIRKGYKPERIVPVDMFPQTKGLEVVAGLIGK